MDDVPDLVRLAGLLAEPARARILWMLIDGSTRPAGELAHGANISPQSATAHLSRLVEGGLLVTEAQGRHRYFRIPNAEVAGAIEGIATLSAAAWPRPTGDPLPVRKMPAAFVAARTCYGHLAGDMAVKLLAAMVKSGWLLPRGRDFEVTPEGEKKLDALGIDLAAVRAARPVFARACVDLTERRHHLGGALGDALLDLCVERGWVLRQRRSRVVTITPRGAESFRSLFGA